MDRNQSQGPGTKVRPVQEIRLGAIKAAIWRNETETGGVRYNTTFERLYRDGDSWKSSPTFGRDDLLILAKVADQAHTWILTDGREAAAAGSDPRPADQAPLRDTALPKIRA